MVCLFDRSANSRGSLGSDRVTQLLYRHSILSVFSFGAYENTLFKLGVERGGSKQKKMK